MGKEIRIRITRDFYLGIDEIEESIEENILCIPSSKKLSLEEKNYIIETVLLEVPVVLLAIERRPPRKGKEGSIVIVKGGEIIKTMLEFMENKFPLKGMRFFKKLEGKYFSELESKYKCLFWYKNFISFVIKPPTPQYLKHSILDRFINIYEGKISKEEVREIFYKSKDKAWDLINEYANKIFSKSKEDTRTRRRIILEAITIYLIRKGEIEWEKDIPEKEERNMNKTIIILNKYEDVREQIKKYLNEISLEKLEKEFPYIYKKNNNRIGALIYLAYKIGGKNND